MRMVLNTIQSTLNDPQFVAEHRYQPADFTRKRTLTFERVALSLLSGPIASLRNGADALCQGLGLKGVPLGVTKQALSKAYRKFPYEALIELQQQVVSRFADQVPGTRWMGYRLVAVDGTKIRLPLDPELAETFGTQGNQTATERPMALYVSHFDASNGIPLGGELAPSFMGERFLAERLLEERSATDLMLYDRGFPSFALFALHRHLDRAFCARLPVNFCREVTTFLASGASDSIIEWHAGANPKRDCTQLGISAVPLRLRLLRVSLPGGTTEVLATSLFDAEVFPAHLFKDLYRRRWAVEESFKALKPALRVEQFRTRGVLGVYQEVYARFLTLTLASIARALTQPTVAACTGDRKHPHQVNFRAALAKLRTRFFQLWDPADTQGCLDLLVWIARDAESIRPDRSYPRKTKHINPLPFAGV
jgi:hypothetical protein